MNAILSMTILNKSVAAWALFLSVVTILLVLDLGVFHGQNREIKERESILLSLFYVMISFLFGIYIFLTFGAESASQYYTGYLIEKTLSLDNIFVITLIFNYFAVPKIYYHRVLFWGIMGVLIFRGILISIGASLIHQFEWLTYVLAFILIVTGIKMIRLPEEEASFSNNLVITYIQKKFRLTPIIESAHFFIKREGKIWLTPLFLALVLVEITDVIFALDSIPAIFTITTDPYIVLTSNIFAVLGLRALFFCLTTVIDKFYYLKPALAVLLIFIGSKPFVAWLFSSKFPVFLSLGGTVCILGCGILFSFLKEKEIIKPKD